MEFQSQLLLFWCFSTLVTGLSCSRLTAITEYRTMSQILQVHAFLGHSFSKNENLIPDSLKHDLIHQRTQIPYHNIPIHRDGMTGKVVDPDVNFKRSCATATSCGINTANTRVSFIGNRPDLRRLNQQL